MLNNIRYLTILLFALVLIVSCTNSAPVTIEDLPSEVVCVLNQEDKPIGQISSISYVSDSLFAIGTYSQVYLYDLKGELVRMLGRQGRAYGEYAMPMYVRSDSSRVVVWDGMLTKFVYYDLSGNLLGEVKYEGGVSDFIVKGDSLYIYITDKMSDICVKRVDISTKEVTPMEYIKVADEHHILNRWTSCAPLSIDGDVVYASPRNSLAIYGSDDSVVKFKSETFNLDPESDCRSILDDRNKTQGYLQENAFVVSIIPVGNTFYLLSEEGTLKKSEKGVDRSNRFYTLYAINRMRGQVSKVIRFPQETFSHDLVTWGHDSLWYVSQYIANNQDVFAIYCYRL